jgi:hypothetical protein
MDGVKQDGRPSCLTPSNHPYERARSCQVDALIDGRHSTFCAPLIGPAGRRLIIQGVLRRNAMPSPQELRVCQRVRISRPSAVLGLGASPTIRSLQMPRGTCRRVYRVGRRFSRVSQFFMPWMLCTRV